MADHAADHSAGYVTAETAMVLPVLAILLAVGLWAVAVAGAQLRCIDAARDAARAVARGESDSSASAAASAAAPPGAHIDIGHVGNRVVVVVSVRVGKGLGPLSAVSIPTVAATATAESEADP
jgi:Flp pilus assembly protein TadG